MENRFCNWMINTILLVLIIPINMSVLYVIREFENNSKIPIYDFMTLFSNDNPYNQFNQVICIVVPFLYFLLIHYLLFKTIYVFNNVCFQPWIRYKQISQLIPGFVYVKLSPDKSRLIIKAHAKGLNDMLNLERELIGSEIIHSIFRKGLLDISYSRIKQYVLDMVNALKDPRENFESTSSKFPTLLSNYTKQGKRKYYEISYISVTSDQMDYGERAMIIYFKDKTKETLMKKEAIKNQTIISKQYVVNEQQRNTMETMLQHLQDSMVGLGENLNVDPGFLKNLAITFSNIKKISQQNKKSLMDESNPLIHQHELQLEINKINELQSSILSLFELIESQNSELNEKVRLIEEQNKELQSMDQLKDEFLANTSHELRTPLNGIIGISESMMGGALGNFTNDQISNNLSIIGSCGRRLSNLINDLLDLSKIRDNSLQIIKTPVNIRSTVKVVLELAKQLIRNKDLELVNKISEHTKLIYADEGRLEQILFNLVGNAIKYTQSGHITVEAKEKNEDMVLSVSDTGIGIKKEDFGKIFHPLQQLNGEATRTYDGTGLGLPITKHLIELHGGSINIESILGVGSKFSFNIPIAGEEKQSSEQPNAMFKQVSNYAYNYTDLALNIEDTEEADFREKKGLTSILVVDDDSVNIQVLKNYFSSKNYQVLCAKNGVEGLDIIENNTPDIVLLDLMMPNMSGPDFCRIVRKTKDLISLPIIMITARSQIKDILEGFKAGANDYLVKPFFEKELLVRINTLLQAKDSVERLKENEILKNEIAKRTVVEEKLDSSQRRLTRVIDNADEVIICANQFNKITFFNKKAENELGYNSRELLNNDIKIVFPELQLEKDWYEGERGAPTDDYKTREEKEIILIHKNQNEFKQEIFISYFFQENDPFYAVTYHPLSSSGIPSVDEKADLKYLIRQRIKAIESNLSGTRKYIDQGGLSLIEELRQIEASLDGRSENLLNDQNSALRHLMVDVMKKSLEFWAKFTHKSVLDFANESKIWKPYLDKGTWQTRTLNRYLKINTLPKRPRWRDIIRSVKFVIPICPEASEEKSKLEELLFQLEKELLNQ